MEALAHLVIGRVMTAAVVGICVVAGTYMITSSISGSLWFGVATFLYTATRMYDNLSTLYVLSEIKKKIGR
ncbi:hypothetical protein HY413_02355 [Candidatus Kaiserbacteria bacterium]|nr:hypothetical protein [Candidatus Kaiserbacteria bacterium]